jgi:hypothetical protein
VSAIPPIEPSRPVHLVRFEDRRRDRDPQDRDERPDERDREDEELEDDGLPHVDVRA